MKKNYYSLTKISRIAFLLLSVFIVISCEGPQGDIGPRGYDGTDGLDGIDGINYTGSAIYDVVPADWYGDLDRYDVTLNVPEITEDIYYNGAVLVYNMVETEPKSFNALPYTYVDQTYAYYMDYDAYVGSIDIFFKEIIEGINTSARPTAMMTFKVVIIEGLSFDALKEKVNINDYNEVARFLGK